MVQVYMIYGRASVQDLGADLWNSVVFQCYCGQGFSGLSVDSRLGVSRKTYTPTARLSWGGAASLGVVKDGIMWHYVQCSICLGEELWLELIIHLTLHFW